MATKAKKTEVEATPKKEAKIVKKAVVKAEVAEKKVVKKAVVKKTKVAEAVVEPASVKDSVEAMAVVETPVEETEAPVKSSGSEAVTVEALFEAGAHFGHVVKKWNPKMKKYLWGEKNGIHIFDLEQTVKAIDEATKTLTELASTGKRIVMVGTKRQARTMVEEAAVRAGIPFITQRWLGGLVSNWRQVKLSIDRLNSLKSKKEKGELKKFTKKEQGGFDKEIARLERRVGGLATLKDFPEVLVIIDTHKERLAVREGKNRHCIIIGLTDSNANPDNIDFPIPMNDDSAKGLEIVIGALENAISKGIKNLKK